MRNVGLILLFILVGIAYTATKNAERSHNLLHTRYRLEATSSHLGYISDCLRSYAKSMGIIRLTTKAC